MISLPARATPTSWPAISLILAAACWGTGTVLSKQAVGVAQPLLLLPAQLASSLAFLAIVARIRGEPIRLLSRPRRVGLLGLLNPGIAYALALVGLTQVSASVAVVVWATEPAMVALLAAVTLREHLGRAVTGFSVLAVVGIVILAGEAGTGTTLSGVAILTAAVLCCALYTVATRRWLPAVPETLGLVTAQQAAALGLALFLTLAATLVTGPGLLSGSAPLRAPSPIVIVSIVGSGLVYYGLAYWFYLSGLRHVSAGIAATSFYLVPVFGLVVAFGFGDRLDVRAWVGIALVLLAVTGIAAVSRADDRGRAVDGNVRKAID